MHAIGAQGVGDAADVHALDGLALGAMVIENPLNDGRQFVVAHDFFVYVLSNGASPRTGVLARHVTPRCHQEGPVQCKDESKQLDGAG